MKSFSVLHCYKSHTKPDEHGHSYQAEGNCCVAEVCAPTFDKAVQSLQASHPHFGLDDTGYSRLENGTAYILAEAVYV